MLDQSFLQALLLPPNLDLSPACTCGRAQHPVPQVSHDFREVDFVCAFDAFESLLSHVSVVRKGCHILQGACSLVRDSILSRTPAYCS